MSITLKPGTRLLSNVCTTELITVRASAEPCELTIGGRPPALSAADREDSGPVIEGHAGGAQMGKRYVDADDTVELLCTKAGEGVPAIDGELLVLKEAKPLPASD